MTQLIYTGPTKAISVRAPWWWAILHAGKDIENRDWSTKYRGTVLLHASKWHGMRDVRDDVETIANITRRTGVRPPDSTLAEGRVLTHRLLQASRGCIVGRVDIVDCVDRSDSHWFFGRYGFVLANPVAFSRPVPCKGALSFFEVPADVLANIDELEGVSMSLVYGSVCSGIEAATVAWHPLGWRLAWFSEIEAFPRAVLAHHYPDVPCHGDFREVPSDEFASLDLLVGGTPCQAFSVAGLRGSLSDDRGNLTLEFVRLANAIDDARAGAGHPPAIFVWENVDGVLSMEDNAFGCFLSGMVGEDTPIVPPREGFKRRWKHTKRGADYFSWSNSGLVIGPRRAAAWTVKDAQYFGLAQRREHVFVVASAMAGFDPSAVLFEPEGVRRHHPPSREAGPDAACGTLGGTGPGSGWRLGADEAAAGHLVAGTLSRRPERGGAGSEANGNGLVVTAAFGGNNTSGHIDVATALNACHTASGRQDFETETFIAYRTSGNCGAWDTGDRTDALTTSTDPNSHIIAYQCHGSNVGPMGTLRAGNGNEAGDVPFVATALRARDAAKGVDSDCTDTLIAHTLRGEGFDASEDGTGRGTPLTPTEGGVRRLMPVECERLQGFPDHYTLIPWRGKPADTCPDGPRYRALGNSMAVPCMRWIGERIQKHLNAITAPSRAAE